MTNQRIVNASLIFHIHALFLPTMLYVGSVPVNTDLLELVISNTTAMDEIHWIELNWVADIRLNLPQEM